MAKTFEKTRWTLVLRAGDKSDVFAAKRALGELCALYWEPVYQLIRRYRPSAGKDDARDLTQGFFASLLERGGVASADRERGRFRSWMFGAVRHYLWNVSASANAERRRVDAISLDSDDAAGQGARNQHAHDVSPEQLFARNWARVVLGNALAKLPDTSLATAHPARFGRVRELVLGPQGEQPNYPPIAQELGENVGTIKTYVSRLRDALGELVRAEIADVVDEVSEIDDELRFLLDALGVRDLGDHA